MDEKSENKPCLREEWMREGKGREESGERENDNYDFYTPPYQNGRSATGLRIGSIATGYMRLHQASAGTVCVYITSAGLACIL